MLINRTLARNALRSLGEALALAPVAEATPAMIAEALSHRDIDRALELALRQAHPLRDEYIWVRDVFDDAVIYELSGRGGDMASVLYRRTYSISDDGAVTLGEPEPVTMQTIYVPAESASQPAEPTAQTAESVALTSDLVPLVEKAVRDDNTVPLKIIQPGWGSSGYYSPDLLKRDGPKVFTAGLHMYLDHPTESENSERPERSVKDLAGRLVSDAVWQEDGPAGPGLYAEAEVFAPFRDVLDEIAPHIGVSIRAAGRISEGEADGKRGRIVEELVQAESVDWVTRAGAGGQVVTIMESARGATRERVAETTQQPQEDTVQLEEAQNKITALEAEVARLRGANLLNEARSAVAAQLVSVDLPAFAKRRILEAALANLPEKDGALDKDTLTATVEAQVSAWRADLAEAGDYSVSGMGSLGEGEGGSGDIDPDAVLTEALQTIGLPESTAKLAARGR